MAVGKRTRKGLFLCTEHSTGKQYKIVPEHIVYFCPGDEEGTIDVMLSTGGCIVITGRSEEDSESPILVVNWPEETGRW